MRNSFFNQPATVVTALLTPADDQEGTLAMIRNAAEQGAQGIAIQMMQMPPEQRTEDNLRRLMDAAPQLPFMFIDYRGDKWLGGDDDARQECLFAAARAGAEVVDVMGDLYDPAPREWTRNPRAIAKQKRLISKIHAAGAQVIQSAHLFAFAEPESVVEQLKDFEKRGADIVKLVQNADTEDEFLAALRATMLCRRELKTPFVHLVGGKFSTLHRAIAPMLGIALTFVTLDQRGAFPMGQPPLSALKGVFESLRFHIDQLEA